MSRLLVIQNDPLSPAGIVAAEAAAAGYEMEVVQPHHDAGVRIPGADAGFAGLIVGGGPMSAGDDGIYPALPRIVQAIRDFHAADLPVLGLCLGAQLIARGFGEAVKRKVVREVGYVPVDLTPQAASDPLLAGLHGPCHVIEWHEDHYDLPRNAVRLMTNAASANQAFRIGRATYGFQCHIEATPAAARDWVDTLAREDEKAGLSRQVEADIAAYGEETAALGALIARRWLALTQSR